jgi:hypothetical protein
MNFLILATVRVRTLTKRPRELLNFAVLIALTCDILCPSLETTSVSKNGSHF